MDKILFIFIVLLLFFNNYDYSNDDLEYLNEVEYEQTGYDNDQIEKIHNKITNPDELDKKVLEMVEEPKSTPDGEKYLDGETEITIREYIEDENTGEINTLRVVIANDDYEVLEMYIDIGYKGSPEKPVLMSWSFF